MLGDSDRGSLDHSALEEGKEGWYTYEYEYVSLYVPCRIFTPRRQKIIQYGKRPSDGFLVIPRSEKTAIYIHHHILSLDKSKTWGPASSRTKEWDLALALALALGRHLRTREID